MIKVITIAIIIKIPNIRNKEKNASKTLAKIKKLNLKPNDKTTLKLEQKSKNVRKITSIMGFFPRSG